MDDLLHKIGEKEAVVGIIGLGYTGLSLAHDFGTEGFKVIGYDIDTSKIEALKQRQSYLPFMPHGQLFYLLDEERFIPTSDPNDLASADVFIISVPTPLNKQRQPDISYIQKACHTIASAMKRQPAYATARVRNNSARPEPEMLPPRLVILQSTTYPGTTEEEVLPILEQETGLKAGVDFYLAHVPEREDAGNPSAILNQIPRICGGVTSKCTQLAKALYEHITVRVYPCPTARIAEATKIYENTFRLINIAFVDEMKMVFDKMGIDIWEVIKAASTKPFGFTAFYPGPGIGGECIPVDPLYLAWAARKLGIETTMINNASLINLKTSEYVVEKITSALDTQHKKLQGAKILILGVAFKKDVGDIRESPGLRIIEMLQKNGAVVTYHDYFVPKLPALNMESIVLNEKTLAEADCVVIITDHSQYDWTWVCKNSPLILDTRNATKNLDHHLRKNIIT